MLARVTPEDVRHEPFPHVVVKNALDDETCPRLLAEYPPLSAFGPTTQSNKRLGLSASDFLDDSTGAELEICRYSSRRRGFRGPEVFDRFIETPHVRRFINLIASLRRPLFDIEAYQATSVDRLLAGREIVAGRLRRLSAA